MDDVARCARPGCSRPLTRRVTGRPARYCGPNCRKAGQRERDRRARAEQQRAAQLAKARVAVARERRRLEQHVERAPELAAEVVELASEDNRQALDLALYLYREEASGIEIAALKYFTAAARVAQLNGRARRR
jgi:hypothetical protein